MNIKNKDFEKDMQELKSHLILGCSPNYCYSCRIVRKINKIIDFHLYDDSSELFKNIKVKQ